MLTFDTYNDMLSHCAAKWPGHCPHATAALKMSQMKMRHKEQPGWAPQWRIKK